MTQERSLEDKWIPEIGRQRLARIIQNKCLSPFDDGYFVNLDPIWSDPESLGLAERVVSDFLVKLKAEWAYDAIVVPIRISRTFGVLPIVGAASARSSVPIVVWEAFACPISGEAFTFPIDFVPKSPILFDGVLAKGKGITCTMIDLIKGKSFDMQGIACIVDMKLGGSQYVKDKTAPTLGRQIKFSSLLDIDDVVVKKND